MFQNILKQMKEGVKELVSRLFDVSLEDEVDLKENKDKRRLHLVAFIAIIFVALYLGGCIGIIVNPYKYGMEFGLFHAVKIAFTTKAGFSGFVFIFIIFLAFMAYLSFISRRRRNEDERNFRFSEKGTYGTSRLSIPKEYGEFLQLTDSALETDGIILGKTLDGKKVVSIPKDSPYNRNFFISGSQGTYKSLAFSRNMAIQCAIRGESFFMTDPKGELCRDLAYYLKSEGYVVVRWNLGSRWNSNGWDILHEIGNGDNLEYVDILCHTIIQNTLEGDKPDHFFDSIEEVLLKSLILYVVKVLPKSQHKFSVVYNMLLTENADSLDAKFATLPVSHPARMSYNLFCQSPVNKGNAILGLGARLKIFMDEAIQGMTGFQDIDLESAAWKKTAIFCMPSDKTKTYSVLNALMISMAFIKIMDYADRQPNGKCDIPVYFILDELPNIGLIDALQDKEGTARSRDIGLCLMVQNIPQFMNRFPNGIWEELIGGCDFRFCLGCNETTTSEYFSVMTGTSTIEVETERKNLKTIRLTDFTPEIAQSEGAGQRATLLEDEIRRLDPSELLLFIRGKQTIKLKKFNFVEHPEALKMRKIMPQEFTPRWRFDKSGTDKSGKGEKYISEEALYRKIGADDTRFVVQDSSKWGPQRTNAIEELKRMKRKYASDGKFPNGHNFFDASKQGSCTGKDVHILNEYPTEEEIKEKDLDTSAAGSDFDPSEYINTEPFSNTENDSSIEFEMSDPASIFGLPIEDEMPFGTFDIDKKDFQQDDQRSDLDELLNMFKEN